MEDNRKMTSELRSNRNEGKIKSNRRGASKWSVVKISDSDRIAVFDLL